MVDDTRTITLHVLSAAGLGIRQDFGHGTAEAKPGHILTYRDAVKGILAHLTKIMIFPPKLFDLSFMQKTMKDAGLALKEMGS
jgi:hypothetical protein